MHSFGRKSATAAALAAVVLPALAAVGCGDKHPKPMVSGAEASPFTVHGKVTYDGKPLPGGFVAFYSDKNLEGNDTTEVPKVCPIRPADGFYEIVHPPLGPCVVCVFTEPGFTLRKAQRSGTLHSDRPGSGPEPQRPDRFEVKNPQMDKLSDVEKEFMRQLHEQYGSFRNTPLRFVVAGQADDEYDIELKFTGETTTTVKQP
jgi:hypothetical protein